MTMSINEDKKTEDAMTTIYRYSWFYVMQPVLGDIFLLCLLALFMYAAPARYKPVSDMVVWWLLVLLCVALILAGFWLYLKREKEPVEIRVTNRSISSSYRNGTGVEIFWDEVDSVQVKRSWQAAAQVMEVTSKDKSKRIVCTNYLPNWDNLNQDVANYVHDRYSA
jgi:hypothetical protein